MTAKIVKAWEQQEKESPEAFEAFALYRDMGSKRSTAKVARELGKSKQLMDRWCGRHKWVDRSGAFDREQDRRITEAQMQEVEKMRVRHIQTSMALQGLGATELNKLIAQAKTAKKALLAPKEVMRLLRDGTTMERLNRGEPGDIVQTRGEEVDLSELSMDELRELKRLNKIARGE